MGAYKYIAQSWKKPKTGLGDLWKKRMVEWRKENSITKIERPTRLDRARSLGYRAKRGFVLARVRLDRGGRKRTKMMSGRRSKTQRRMKILGMNYQWVAEQRAQGTFKNLEVLNSYPLAKDGTHYWFEVILVDPNAPEIRSDIRLSWIAQPSHGYRVLRGKTSAGKKSRGMRGKGKGHEKNRPSLGAHSKRGKC